MRQQHKRWVHQFADGSLVTMEDPAVGITPCDSNNHLFCTVSTCTCPHHDENVTGKSEEITA